MRLTADELDARAAQARAALESCTLCGHRCKVNRAAGQFGRCRCGAGPVLVALADLHPGEEPALGPQAGTIFFSGCNLACAYCQNWQISQGRKGTEMTASALADAMLAVAERGAANVELVSPTPWVAQIIEALAVAARRGLRLPVVYNTGGYDSLEALRLLDGAVDIYLPDMRYSWSTAAERFSGARDYPAVNRAAVQEMYRQVGDLTFADGQRAASGLLIRLLVLPNGLAGTRETLQWISRNLSRETWFSLMAQYAPAHKAGQFIELNRAITEREYRDLLDYTDKLQLENFYTQAPESTKALRPDFTKARPFDA